MSKQIYIDSNGNEIQVSGTVNTADMMPMSGNDSTKVSEAIGDLSQLTTSVTSSLVGAVNEVCEVIDISSAFVPNSSISNYDFFVRAYYNKGLKKVSGSFSCRVTSGTMGSVPMCTIELQEPLWSYKGKYCC